MYTETEKRLRLASFAWLRDALILLIDSQALAKGDPVMPCYSINKTKGNITNHKRSSMMPAGFQVGFLPPGSPAGHAMGDREEHIVSMRLSGECR